MERHADGPDAVLDTGGRVLGDKADVLARVAAAIDTGDLDRGRRILRTEYPFAPVAKNSRKYTDRQCLRVFYRDGFLDRYSGAKLVHPGALRSLSLVMPEEFPAHPNWSMTQSHFAFWELFPTIDHLVPVARGGADEEANWVSTSMLRNSAKAHWTLDELGWGLVERGDHTRWDGLAGWFLDYVRAHPELMDDKYLARWFRATVDVCAQLP
ncbi:HNH endonuclease [Rhodococcus chondri]|uniref:HNH endonuclease n=1 Tax=Rhodococcus chondri TaxID=3065941 RepID=A0ABU7JQC5_9NOCA|nr:HNH endonuclease [Rhodococcus sp. CC-R104]MEE2031694.1 HNH endonuclease [Rhodococcus sp. CC-R104]